MNRIDEFDELVNAARQELPPSIDVAASVLATVRTQQAMEAPDAMTWGPRMAAALALAVAVLTVIPALQAFSTLSNPMTALFGTLRNAL
jgi:hypothetical protein